MVRGVEGVVFATGGCGAFVGWESELSVVGRMLVGGGCTLGIHTLGSDHQWRGVGRQVNFL